MPYFPEPDGGGTDDQTAAEVPITDAGGYYTGTDVEAALQEVGDHGLVLIGQVVLGTTAPSISFSSIPANYRDLVLIGELRSNSGLSNEVVQMRLGNGTVDSGANYRYHYSVINEAASVANAEAEGATKLELGYCAGGSGDSGVFGSFQGAVLAYANSGRYRSVVADGRVMSDATGTEVTAGGGVWQNNTSVVDTVSVFPGIGSVFAAGSYLSLYGRGSSFS